MILKVLEQPKIDYTRPTLTLDVNQIALKNPSQWPPEMEGLVQLEWNYFELRKVELCVTHETPDEITQRADLSRLGEVAYNRFQKSRLFKTRPPGTTLDLKGDEPNILWMGIRNILFPSVDDAHLTSNQIADIKQIFYHCTASGSLANSAFITIDTNFHRRAGELESELGITVMTTHEAWDEYGSKYDLYMPNGKEIKYLLDKQHEYLQRLKDESNR